jgi:hypothetical protein
MAEYRGWGILVLIVPFAWIFAMIALVLAFGRYEPNLARAGAMADWTIGSGLLLGAATLWVVSQHRSAVAPGRDSFIGFPMRYFPYPVAAGAVFCFALPWMPTFPPWVDKVMEWIGAHHLI